MAGDHTDYEFEPATVPSGAIFVAADEPLLVYPSAAAAASHLEGVDVRDGTYPAAYGPLGQPYAVRSVGDTVIVEPTCDQLKPEELRLLLARYLDAVGRSFDLAAPLEDLVAQVWTIERDFWLEHDPDGERFDTRSSAWGCAGIAALLAATVYLIVR